ETDSDKEARTAVFFAAAGTNSAAAQGIQHATTDQADHQDTENDSGDTDAEPHVAVQNVAEFVGDHALQFIAGEFVERAACDSHGGIAGGEAGGKRIESGLVLQDVDRGHRNA